MMAHVVVEKVDGADFKFCRNQAKKLLSNVVAVMITARKLLCMQNKVD